MAEGGGCNNNSSLVIFDMRIFLEATQDENIWSEETDEDSNISKEVGHISFIYSSHFRHLPLQLDETFKLMDLVSLGGVERGGGIHWIL